MFQASGQVKAENWLRSGTQRLAGWATSVFPTKFTFNYRVPGGARLGGRYGESAVDEVFGKTGAYRRNQAGQGEQIAEKAWNHQQDAPQHGYAAVNHLTGRQLAPRQCLLRANQCRHALRADDRHAGGGGQQQQPQCGDKAQHPDDAYQQQDLDEGQGPKQQQKGSANVHVTLTGLESRDFVIGLCAMSADYCLVLCTCPDADTANELAVALVEQRLAACVNVLPGVTSVYGWDGRVEKASEQLLLIKTEAGGLAGLETFIKQRHSYEVPEIIAIPIERGSQDYFDWISAWVGQRS